MAAVASLLEQELDEISLLAIQFLYAYVCEASLVESYEADNFILRNSATFYAWYVVEPYSYIQNDKARLS